MDLIHHQIRIQIQIQQQITIHQIHHMELRRRQVMHLQQQVRIKTLVQLLDHP